MNVRSILVALVVAVLVLAGGARLWHFLSIDRCLDRGGAWIEARSLCVGAAD